MDPPSVKLLAAMAALIRAYAGTQEKPVWVGEFNTCIKELPEKGQAEWLEKAVLAGIEQGVSWFTYWDSHDVDRKFEFNPLEYTPGPADQRWPREGTGPVFKQLAELSRQAGSVSEEQRIAASAGSDAGWNVALGAGLDGVEGTGRPA